MSRKICVVTGTRAEYGQLKAQSQRTVAYPMHELWLDVGRHEDLERAQGIIPLENEAQI